MSKLYVLVTFVWCTCYIVRFIYEIRHAAFVVVSLETSPMYIVHVNFSDIIFVEIHYTGNGNRTKKKRIPSVMYYLIDTINT